LPLLATNPGDATGLNDIKPFMILALIDLNMCKLLKKRNYVCVGEIVREREVGR